MSFIRPSIKIKITVLHLNGLHTAITVSKYGGMGNKSNLNIGKILPAPSVAQSQNRYFLIACMFYLGLSKSSTPTLV